MLPVAEFRPRTLYFEGRISPSEELPAIAMGWLDPILYAAAASCPRPPRGGHDRPAPANHPDNPYMRRRYER